MIKCLLTNSANIEIIYEQKPVSLTGKQTIMVCLGSNHIHAHVIKELELSSAFVTVGSYPVAFDIIVRELSADLYTDHPWAISNYPKTAVYEFLRSHDDFKTN